MPTGAEWRWRRGVLVRALMGGGGRERRERTAVVCPVPARMGAEGTNEEGMPCPAARVHARAHR